MKKYCCCCGEQLLGTGPFTIMGTNALACKECSRDLDNNGNFPEELVVAPREGWPYDVSIITYPDGSGSIKGLVPF